MINDKAVETVHDSYVAFLQIRFQSHTIYSALNTDIESSSKLSLSGFQNSMHRQRTCDVLTPKAGAKVTSSWASKGPW